MDGVLHRQLFHLSHGSVCTSYVGLEQKTRSFCRDFLPQTVLREYDIVETSDDIAVPW